MILQSIFFQEPPFTALRAIQVANKDLLLNCCSQRQADEVLDLADDICRAAPELDRVWIYVCGRHAYGFPIKISRNTRSKFRNSRSDLPLQD